MAVPAVNLTIDKETTFSENFKLKKDGAPIDLTDYTFSAKMKKSYTSSSFYEFDVEALEPYSDGIIKVGMASSVTAAIPTGRYVYDVLITISTNTIKVIEGNILVKGTAS